MKVYSDARWIGQHGIGRFALEVSLRVGFEPAKLPLTPYSPFDVFITTAWLAFNFRRRLFSPGYNAPLFFLDRYTFVVHDLNHIDLPYNSSLLKRLYYEHILKRACRKARSVLTVSNFTAERIAHWADIPVDRIKVVGNGVSKAFVPEGPKHEEVSKYFLLVGNRKMHKNESLAINALALLKGYEKCNLIFVGPKSDALSTLADQLNISQRIRFVEDLSEKLLASYYRGASGLIFPSLYEGFGLPIIEAMACGCPVIASNVTAMPEVCGDAALLIDPTKTSEIAHQMRRLLSDTRLVSDLKARGLINARRFSWDEVAAKVEVQLECAL